MLGEEVQVLDVHHRVEQQNVLALHIGQGVARGHGGDDDLGHPQRQLVHGGGGHGCAAGAADGHDAVQLAVGVELAHDALQAHDHVGRGLAAHVAADDLLIIGARHLGLGDEHPWRAGLFHAHVDDVHLVAKGFQLLFQKQSLVAFGVHGAAKDNGLLTVFHMDDPPVTGPLAGPALF